MKKTWILLLILCGFAMAQRPYNNQRSGYAQNILWRDLHPSTQDSLRKVIGDSVAALSIDGFSLFVNADNQIAQKVYADTTALKAASGDSLGSFVNLKQLSSSNANGGGLYIYADSTLPEGVIAFGAAIAGKQWISQRYKETGTIYVTDAGATPESGDDDTAEIQRALNIAGRKTIFFPDGDYTVNDTSVNANKSYFLRISTDSTTLDFASKKAVIRNDSTYVNKRFLEIDASNIELRGGKIISSWLPSMDGRNKTSAEVAASAFPTYGIQNNSDIIWIPDSSDLWSAQEFKDSAYRENLTFENMEFRGARSQALQFAAPIRNVVIRDCNIIENQGGIHFENYLNYGDRASANKNKWAMRDIKIVNNTIKRTAYPATDANPDVTAGNGLTTQGGILNLLVDGNTLIDCGRRGWEGFPFTPQLPDSLENDSLSVEKTNVTEIIFVNNHWGDSWSRTLTAQVNGGVISNNVIIDTTSTIEYDFTNTTFSNNFVVAAGISDVDQLTFPGDSTLYLRKLGNYEIIGNTFWLLGTQGFRQLGGKNIRFNNNQVFYRTPDKATDGLIFTKCKHVQIKNNVFESQVPTIGSMLNLTTCQFIDVVGNEFRDNPFITQTFSTAPINITRSANLKIKDNDLRFKSSISVGSNAILFSGNPDSLYLHKWGGSSWTSYKVLGRQQAPPGSPSSGDAYLITRTPSGAWAGYDVQSAIYNGSSWDIAPIKHFQFRASTDTAFTRIVGVDSLPEIGFSSGDILLTGYFTTDVTLEDNNIYMRERLDANRKIIGVTADLINNIRTNGNNFEVRTLDSDDLFHTNWNNQFLLLDTVSTAATVVPGVYYNTYGQPTVLEFDYVVTNGSTWEDAGRVKIATTGTSSATTKQDSIGTSTINFSAAVTNNILQLKYTTNVGLSGTTRYLWIRNRKGFRYYEYSY